MHKHYNHLRIHRRKSPLSLEDLSQLLNEEGVVSLSRYECGYKPPTIDVLITYSLIFNKGIDEFLLKEIKPKHGKLIERLKELIDAYERMPDSVKVKARLKFLKTTITRLDEKFRSMNEKHHNSIFAIYPNAHGFGYVFLTSPTTLSEYGSVRSETALFQESH